MAKRCGGRLAGLALACALALAITGTAGARSRTLPDLRLRALGNPPPVLVAGQSFSVRDLVVNSGRAPARRSVVGYYLERHRVRLARVGRRSVGPLGPRRGSSALVALRVPAGLAVGTYRLLACADVHHRVRESSERNNCRASRTVVRVRAPAAPQPPLTPPSPPAPTPPGSPSTETTPSPPTAANPPPAVDTTKPTVAISLSPGSPNGANGWYTSMPTVHASAADENLSGPPSCTVDGKSVALTNESGNSEGDVPVSGDGNHTVTCTASDTAGNTSDPATVTFKVDSIAPSVALAAPADGATTALMDFSGSAGEDGDVTVKVYGGTSASGTPVQTQTASASGGTWVLTLSPVLADGQVYTAQAEQQDAAGNVGKSAAHTFTVPYTLLAAGDIASCISTGDEATAALLAHRAGTIATLGDNVYSDGTTDAEGSLQNFNHCFEPSWGPFKSPRMRPAPGNHEYNSSSTAAGYFDYFGAVASQGTNGDYSYDIGSWHVIVLNTNSDCTTISCAAGSAQETWLKNDLAAHPSTCTLAYFHHPRFSSYLGADTAVKPLWDDLYAAGGDLVLNGHAHNYERYKPQDPNGNVDTTYGITEFISGTGGASHHTTNVTDANSVIFNDTTFGILQLTLRSGGYDYRFVPAAGTGPWSGESGSGSCHGAP